VVAERMQVLAGAPILTAEEFYANCSLDRAELIDGAVVAKMPPGFDHGDIALTIGSLLRAHVRQHKVGRVSVEGGFLLGRDPDVVRSPDVWFVESSRLEGVSTHAFIEGPPTLAVEVVSPGDHWSEVEEKVQEYLAAGSLAVWVIDPRTQRVTVRTPDEVRVYQQHENLDGAPALPGFSMALSEVFER
jgi:Uma2 family endonuclease